MLNVYQTLNPDVAAATPAAQPVQNTPAAAPAVGQPPAPQSDSSGADNPVPAQPNPATDGAPAQPSAQASASARPPRGGFFESVLTGALKGAVDHGARIATTAAQNAGKGVAAVGKNSGIGQNIQNQNLARQAKQQEMQQKQVAATDEHQEAMLRYNSMSMDNMHKAAENAQIESLYPLQTQEAKNTLLSQIRAQNDADIKFLTTLEEAGVHIDTSHFTQGGPFDQLTSDHATQIAQGKQVALNNGKTGSDADLAFVSTAELANTVLSHDMNVVTDWNLDPKTGEATPVYSTLQAGHNTALDALIAHDAGMDKFNQKQDMFAKQAANKNTAAGGTNLDSRPPDQTAVNTFVDTVLPGYKNIDSSEVPGLKAEAQNAKTTRDLENVQNKALSLEQAGVNKKLTQENTKAVRDANLDAANTKAANEDLFKIWSDPQHGYSQFGAQADAWKSDISASQNGNQLASNLEPVMAALGVSSFAGVHRINDTEVQNAGPEVGSLYRRFNALLDKAGEGSLPPDTLNDAANLIDALVKARYTSALRATQLVAGNYRIDPNTLTVTDMGGNPVTLSEATQTLAAKQKGNASRIPSAVQNALSGVGAGVHTLSDGSVWIKNSDGSVTPSAPAQKPRPQKTSSNLPGQNIAITGPQ